jgi:hypothetical protein
MKSLPHQLLKIQLKINFKTENQIKCLVKFEIHFQIFDPKNRPKTGFRLLFCQMSGTSGHQRYMLIVLAKG